MAESSPPRHRVLIAEDDYAWRVTIVRLLESAGFDVVAARDGVAGAEVLEDKAQVLHLAITDFRMPRGSGWRVIEAARQFRGAEFPVIMQTAESQYADVYERAALMRVPIIAKAEIATRLLPLVRTVLGIAE